jgi:hypothetical protein
MSKIFEALKRAESKRTDTTTSRASIPGHTERRRTGRIHVHIPLFIYGYTPAGKPFYEETHTIVISGTGGLISTKSRVHPGQRLVVTNEGNDQTQECVVVSVKPQRLRSKHIALKFPTPTPQFWRGLEIGKSAAPRNESVR